MLKQQETYIKMNDEWEEGSLGLMAGDGEYICNLKPQTAYVFSKEELQTLLENVYDYARSDEEIIYKGNKTGKLLYKQEYLSDLLNE